MEREQFLSEYNKAREYQNDYIVTLVMNLNDKPTFLTVENPLNNLNFEERVVNAGRSGRQRAANAGTGFIVAHQSFSARTADLNPR